MNYKLQYSPEAKSELQESYDYYCSKSVRVGDNFLEKIEETVAFILRYPTMFPVTIRNIRKAVVHKFPYLILYFIEDENIFVLSIFHTKQDPQKWIKRLNE